MGSHSPSPWRGARELLDEARERSTRFLESLPERRASAPCCAAELVEDLGGPLPRRGLTGSEIIRRLDEFGSKGVVASAGPRYFGFVTGGALPVSLAADWIAAAWDQNAFSETSSPIGSAVESIALQWVLKLLALPMDAGTAFVTGATMANFSCLVAARRRVLLAHGHDVDQEGLRDGPEVTVVVGEQAHATLFKALGLLGLGRGRLLRVPVDDQGRMLVDALPDTPGPAIVCAQAGHVHTGAFDPVGEISEAVRADDVWVHVDGAFGLWARASRRHAQLAAGVDQADSWATDAHKWLNVPYDSGLAIVRHSDALRDAISMQASYLPERANRDPFDFTPESSRRARGIAVWAALASLGRDGVEALVDRCCRHARRLAEGFQDAGYQVLNDVVLNQVLVAFGDDRVTQEVIREVQRDGTCWCGGARWDGQAVMRISVSSWATTDDDVDQSLATILRIARAVTAEIG